MPRRASSFGAREDVLVARLPAQGQDRVVLEQEQPVLDRAFGTLRDELLLELPRTAVADPPDPGRGDPGLRFHAPDFSRGPFADGSSEGP